MNKKNNQKFLGYGNNRKYTEKGPCLAFLFPWVIIEGDSGRVSTWNCCCFRALGAFNNYVDKKRWVDIQKVHARSTWTKGIELCKMSTIVHICLAHFISFWILVTLVAWFSLRYVPFVYFFLPVLLCKMNKRLRNIFVFS